MSDSLSKKVSNVHRSLEKKRKGTITVGGRGQMKRRELVAPRKKKTEKGMNSSELIRGLPRSTHAGGKLGDQPTSNQKESCFWKDRRSPCPRLRKKETVPAGEKQTGELPLYILNHDPGLEHKERDTTAQR